MFVKYLKKGFTDFQFCEIDKIEDLSKDCIFVEEVSNKKIIQKLLKNKADFGDYFI